jgi:hypothetical protein
MDRQARGPVDEENLIRSSRIRAIMLPGNCADGSCARRTTPEALHARSAVSARATSDETSRLAKYLDSANRAPVNPHGAEHGL